MSTTGSATNGAELSSSLSFVETTDATGDRIPSRCIGLAGIVGFDFIAVVVFRRKFGIVLAINGIVVCSVGCSFPLKAFLRNANRKLGFFCAGSWVCPEDKFDDSKIRDFTNLDLSRHHVYDLPMLYNYVVLLI